MSMQSMLALDQPTRVMREWITQSTEEINLVNKKANNVQDKVIQIISYGSRALNIMLSKVKQNATLQRILLVQQTITTALSIKSTLAQATAIATNNPVGAALLFATVAEMTVVQTQNIIAKENAIRNEEYINSINSQMERYS